jgi:hypothetical protein
MAAATASVLLVYYLGLCWGGPVAALTGAVLMVASPQLFQDSLYARPESVFTFLFLLSVAISIWPSPRPVIRLVLASALMGFLVACKVSALLLVPIPLALFLQQRPWSWQAVALSGVGTLLGAFCGAPYAFIHPALYVAGIVALTQAYGSMLAPHGLRDAPLLERAYYLLGFLNPTVGALSLFLAAWGCWSSLSRRNWMLSTLAIPAVLSIAYFGTGFIFVERNFSHALPVLFILAGRGLADILDRVPVLPAGRVALLVLLIGAAAWPAASVLHTMRFEVLSGAHQSRIEVMRSQIRAQYPAIPFVIWPNLAYGRDLDIYRALTAHIWGVGVKRLLMAGDLRALTAHITQYPFPIIIEFFHYDDRFGAAILNQFRTEFQVHQIAEVAGPFKHISPSTIQAYLACSHPVFFVDGKR